MMDSKLNDAYFYENKRAELEKKFFEHQLSEDEYISLSLDLENEYLTYLYKKIDANPENNPDLLL